MKEIPRPSESLLCWNSKEIVVSEEKGESQEKKSSASGSSMNISSDSSSNLESEVHNESDKDQGLYNSGDESDLLKYDEPKSRFKKRK